MKLARNRLQGHIPAFVFAGAAEGDEHVEHRRQAFFPCAARGEVGGDVVTRQRGRAGREDVGHGADLVDGLFGPWLFLPVVTAAVAGAASPAISMPACSGAVSGVECWKAGRSQRTCPRASSAARSALSATSRSRMTASKDRLASAWSAAEASCEVVLS